MKTGIYAIYDNKAKALTGANFLHLHRHETTAVRMFSEIATDAQTQINKHPDDFELVRLGWLDDSNGEITIADDFAAVMSARTVLDVLAARSREANQA